MLSLDLNQWIGRSIVLAAILVLPILQFLFYNDYLLPRIEVAVVIGVPLLLSLLIAGISRWPRLFDCCVIVVLVLAYAPRLKAAVPIFESVRLRWPALILAGCLIALRYFLREKFYRVLLVFLLAVFLTGVVEGVISPSKLHQRSFEALPATEPPGGSQRPGAVLYLLYLILDAYMGPAGFPADSEPSVLAVQSTVDTFLKHDFTIYVNAYSNYPYTSLTLSSLLALRRLGSESREINPNASALYNLLADRGYRLNVYHTDFFDLCGKPSYVRQCVEYPGNSIGYLKSAKMPWHDRFFAIAASQANASFGGMGAVAGRLWPRYHKYMLSPFSFTEPWRMLVNEVLKGAKSVVHLGHFLIPHDPYVYQADGGVRPLTEWRTNTRDGEGTDDYHAAHRGYAQQVQYLNGRLDELFGSLSEAGLLDSMLVIVHGDHGSRILGPPVDPSMRRTILESHPILFAVKPPGSPAGRIVEEPAGLLTLVAEALGYLGEKPHVPDGDFIELSGGRQLSGKTLALFLEYFVSRKP